MTDQFSDIVGSLQDRGQGGLFIQKRDPRVSVLNVFAARKIESGLEALLVQLDPHILSGLDEWPQSEGFHVNIRPVEGRFEEAALICLELSASRFRDVFFSLAEDIVKVVEPETDPHTAIRKIHRRLIRWQEFLMRNSPDGLSPEQRTGLFGELEVLRTLFLRNLDHVRSVQGWRGCKKASQDFQYPGFAVEVKTTRAMTPDLIYISNVQQLDEEGIDDMFLSLVWVNQNESAGTSLPAIVNEIRSALSDQACTLFNEGLMEVGYFDSHEILYDKELYQVRDIMIFSVEDDFPRMKHSMIPDGVKGVKYQISIDACKPFRKDHKSFLSRLKNLRGKLDNE